MAETFALPDAPPLQNPNCFPVLDAQKELWKKLRKQMLNLKKGQRCIQETRQQKQAGLWPEFSSGEKVSSSVLSVKWTKLLINDQATHE